MVLIPYFMWRMIMFQDYWRKWVNKNILLWNADSSLPDLIDKAKPIMQLSKSRMGLAAIRPRLCVQFCRSVEATCVTTDRLSCGLVVDIESKLRWIWLVWGERWNQTWPLCQDGASLHWRNVERVDSFVSRSFGRSQIDTRQMHLSFGNSLPEK